MYFAVLHDFVTVHVRMIAPSNRACSYAVRLPHLADRELVYADVVSRQHPVVSRRGESNAGEPTAKYT